MAKQLVTVNNLDEFICRGDGKFYMDGTRIITAGAKDALAERHIEIVYGLGCGHAGSSCSEASGCSCQGHDCCSDEIKPEDEEILIAIAATLQKDYGVTDPAKLKAMSLEVVKTLKANLSIY